MYTPVQLDERTINVNPFIFIIYLNQYLSSRSIQFSRASLNAGPYTNKTKKLKPQRD